MKKTFILAVACWASVAASAQLIVNPNGNVAVKSEKTPLSTLSVNGGGYERSEVGITTDGKDGIVVERKKSSENYDWGYAIDASNEATPDIFNVGALQDITREEREPSGQACGHRWMRCGNE